MEVRQGRGTLTSGQRPRAKHRSSQVRSGSGTAVTVGTHRARRRQLKHRAAAGGLLPSDASTGAPDASRSSSNRSRGAPQRSTLSDTNHFIPEDTSRERPAYHRRHHAGWRAGRRRTILLRDAFYETGQYSAVISHDDPRCFLIGRTGSGKSAILQRLEDEQPDHVIRINPEDLSLTYITQLGVIRHLASLDVHLDPLFIALWKHVLLIEIIRHRYNIDSPDAKQNFLMALRDRIMRDRSKQAALDYFEEFEGRFWCETDERVREITRKFEEQVQEQAGGSLSVAGIGRMAGRRKCSSRRHRRADAIGRALSAHCQRDPATAIE